MSNWQPTASPAALRRRAELLARVREHFLMTNALEVTTPVLGAYASAEPTLENLVVSGGGVQGFLRTSPESALKRLLAAGSGDVYEIGPAFRGNEYGRLHLTEFTLLEWYRLGKNHHQLMDDVAALIASAGYSDGILHLTYADLFQSCFACDPHGVGTEELMVLAGHLPLSPESLAGYDRSMLFDALFAHRMSARLSELGAVFVYDFPLELRAYARLDDANPPAAQRFELIIDGIEIANGYYEITNADEQAACFAAENTLAQSRGIAPVQSDEFWLAALRTGLPPVAGVALGIERLQLVLESAATIADVTAFGQ